MATKLLVFGIVFLLVGIAFCAVSFYLGSRAKDAESLVTKSAQAVFFVIGCLTLVTGMLAIVFRGDLTRRAAEYGALAYLVLLTLCMVAFIVIAKTGTGGNDKR